MNPPSSTPFTDSWIRSKFRLARVICIAIISVSTLLSDSPLDDNLNNPQSIVYSLWGGVDFPSVKIPIQQNEFLEAKTDKNKAKPIGEFVILALQMSTSSELNLAAAELMDKHVIPYLEQTKVLHKINASS